MGDATESSFRASLRARKLTRVNATFPHHCCGRERSNRAYQRCEPRAAEPVSADAERHFAAIDLNTANFTDEYAQAVVGGDVEVALPRAQRGGSGHGQPAN